MKKSSIKTIALVLGILIAGFGLMKFLASFKKAPEKKEVSALVRMVKVKKVAYQTIETETEGYGRVRSSQPVQLVSEVGGALMRGDVSLKEGQHFSQGSVLFRIDDAEARLAHQSRKSDLINTIATVLPELKIDYPSAYVRWETFFTQIDINKPLPALPEVVDSKEKLFVTNRKIYTQYYTLKSEEARLARYKFRAPYAGSFSEVKLEPGTIVNPGTPIGRIISTERLEVEVPIKAEELKWVKVGAKTTLKSNQSDGVWKGTIVRISDVIDPSTQSVKVYVEVSASSSNPLFDGMYVQVIFGGHKEQKVMEVTRRALIEEDQVYVVVDDKLIRKKILIHKVNPSTFLFSGLEEGEMLVTESIANMPENTTVKTTIEP